MYETENEQKCTNQKSCELQVILYAMFPSSKTHVYLRTIYLKVFKKHLKGLFGPKFVKL